MEDELLKILVKIIGYSGGFAVVLYWILKTFGKKWLDEKFSKRLEEFKHFQNQEFEHYKFKINKLFNRVLKIQEKEFEVLPEIWIKLQLAYSAINILTASLKSYPDLDRMNQKELEEFLSNLSYPEYQKDELRTFPKKTEHYIKLRFQEEYLEAYHKYWDFNKYLILNKIFLEKDLFELFSNVNKKIYEIYLDARQLSDPRDKFDIYFSTKKDIDAIYLKLKPLIDEIEIAIQKKLHLSDSD